MKPIYDTWLIQIEVTNACIHSCAHCTRAVRHISKPYFAPLTFVEKALQSLDGWNRGVGCMGGEPTIHPEFPEICSLFQRYVPRNRAGIFTSGGPQFEMYHDLIHTTFGIVHYHNHNEISFHKPLMIASEEAVPDAALRESLIKDCWLQRKWSPSICVKGCFFCEVAATFDFLFNGPGGYLIERGWWQKDEHQFQDQVERYCKWCSIPLPFIAYADNVPFEVVSKQNAERLLKAQSPMAENSNLKICQDTILKENLSRLKSNVKRQDSSCYAVTSKNYYCTAPLWPKIWSRNIKNEVIYLLKTGDIYGFLRALSGK